MNTYTVELKTDLYGSEVVEQIELLRSFKDVRVIDKQAVAGRLHALKTAIDMALVEYEKK